MPVKRHVLRSEYRLDAPPRDGSEIIVPIRLELRCYFDRELQSFVLSHPLRMETIRSLDITRWRRGGSP